MARKILIIPSWYPTPSRPLRGSFFQEQARFISANLEVDYRVLYGFKKSSPLLKWFFCFFKALLNSSWDISEEKVQQNPSAYGFTFPANRRIPDSLQLFLERRLFWLAFRTLIKKGWIPSLIHVQSGMDAGIHGHHISVKSGIPFVLIEHQVVIFHHYSRRRARLVLAAYRSALKLGAVSQAQRRQMLIHEPHCNPVVIPNLVDEQGVRLSEFPRSKGFHILTIMYPHTIKGYHTFFEAMKILSNSLTDFTFTVVGNGGAVFENELRALGIAEKGRLVDRADRQEIQDFVSSANVYVCSSDFETFGIAPREAMMGGRPVVSTANGGMEGSILPETGLLVEIRDAAALADAILKIEREYSNYNPARIRELAIDQFGRRVFEERIKDFYDIK